MPEKAIFNNVEASLIQNPSELGMLRNEQIGLRPIQITLKSRDSTIPVNQSDRYIRITDSQPKTVKHTASHL